jgi:hypothetical protein
MTNMRPFLDGPSWLIAPRPDLSAFGLPANLTDPRVHQPNDHCFFQDDSGIWHLWACVRNTAVGRVLCHWESDRLDRSPWRLTGDLIRADRAAGESRVEWQGQEFIQSPYVVRESGRWFLFYGGYATGLDPDGRPTTDYSLMENQISLMTSADGCVWTRHRNAEGLSRVFAGPGAVRDPFFGKFRGRWHCYYAGHHGRDRTKAGIYVRTSTDLITWSDWSVAEFDPAPAQPFIAESPLVVERDGSFLLFRTHGAQGSGTWVVRSEDPMDFGHGEPERLMTVLPVLAPEIVTDENGGEFLSHIYEPDYGFGIRLQRLRWA